MARFIITFAAGLIILECALRWHRRYREWRTLRWWRRRLVSTAAAAARAPPRPWNPVPSGRISGWWPAVLAAWGVSGITVALINRQFVPALEGFIILALAALIEWARRKTAKSASSACAKP